MRRVKDLTVLAGNGSLNQSGKDAIAAELDSLNKDLVSIANSQHLGRNIFAGSSDKRRFHPGTAGPDYSRRPRHPAHLQRHAGKHRGAPHQRQPDYPGRRRRRRNLR